MNNLKTFVEKILNDNSNQQFEFSLGLISDSDIKKIKNLGFDTSNFERLIDTYAIKHTFKHHGDFYKEKNRGQINVITEDFNLIPLILEKGMISYVGKNQQNLDVLQYEYIIGEILYFYFESIRVNRKGKKRIVMETMYKRKAPK